MTIDDTEVGIYRKYDIRRTDGRDAPGEKHDGCHYFVLDLDHDPFAIPALKAYAEACNETHPQLSVHLVMVVEQLKRGDPAWHHLPEPEDLEDGE